MSDLSDAVRRFMIAEMNMHKTYGSTATCHGGIGGSALTQHCSHTCNNSPKHEKEQNEYRLASHALRDALATHDKDLEEIE